MSRDLTSPSPERFGMTSFADLLPARDPILGEDPGSFRDFHRGMMQSLTPFTPYECVVAENLVAIEWELLQHRRMRDANFRRVIHTSVSDAVLAREEARHEAALDEAWDKFIAEGGDEDAWKAPFEFDKAAALKMAEGLAARTVSQDPDLQAEAYAEVVALGLHPVELMSAAYLAWPAPASKHDDKIQSLERRRREVKRDYDALQKARPVDVKAIEAEVVEAEVVEAEVVEAEVVEAEVVGG
ncbi:hypothetical protein [Silicimonas algicola]|uniref:Uncharacterized protein n=1 Tax=Silicimonas algicola TaxID=1826607 RepID=A0A316FXL7_9RHOB|nr:hypothetical protein [Silicimonas algicola]PWK53143.1 hypothetical protein C8D95_11445 [Silicimonas algicola]